MAAQSTAEGERMMVITKSVKAASLTACRRALLHSPVACRAALRKHRAAIDPELAKYLKIVGSYDIKVDLKM